jgi:orotate phosphoribosyltransferase
MTYKEAIIEYMIKINALKFGEFITKSGRLSPYFINTGTFSTGEDIAALGGFYADCIAEHMAAGEIAQDANVIFGPAYKGIPLAVATAIALAEKHGKNLGYCFDRKQEKDHGEGGNLVGSGLKDGDKVIIIDDVITAGTAIRQTLPKLKAAANITIEAMIISVDRMERGQGEKSAVEEVQEDLGIKVYPIITAKDILEKTADKETKEKIEAYLNQYGAQ